MSEILLTSELAARLNRHEATIRRWAAAKLIPSTKSTKRLMIFEWSAVVAEMKERGLRPGKKTHPIAPKCS